MKKQIAVLLCLLLATVPLTSCGHYLPRLEENESESKTVAEIANDTTAAEPDAVTDADGIEENTDADGFPNEPRDGHSKRY